MIVKRRQEKKKLLKFQFEWEKLLDYCLKHGIMSSSLNFLLVITLVMNILMSSVRSLPSATSLQMQSLLMSLKKISFKILLAFELPFVPSLSKKNVSKLQANYFFGA
jgi:hypothetical protein